MPTPSTAFDLAAYASLLEAARAGGYRPTTFDREPEDGAIFVRHDVDLSLEAAVTMAEAEADLGVRATYFLMTESVFYNLASPVGVRALARLRELGHAVGCTPCIRGRCSTSASTRWWPGTTPTPPTCGTPSPARSTSWPATSTRPPTARTRTSTGGPARRTTTFGGPVPWLQLLTHPEIWVFPGATMRETMLAMLDADRASRLRHLADDRIDLT
jgi:hypothetical protein